MHSSPQPQAGPQEGLHKRVSSPSTLQAVSQTHTQEPQSLAVSLQRETVSKTLSRCPPFLKA